jgi:ribonuclease P protein component
MQPYGFTKEDRILKRPEFIELGSNGEKIHDRHFIIVYRPKREGRTRLGITVTKKVGPAVTRNRIKRTLREFFRLNRHQLKGHWDINIIAKHGAAAIDTGQTHASLTRIFHRISKHAQSQ